MAAKRGLNAELCRSLSRCQSSAYFKAAAASLLDVEELNELRQNEKIYQAAYRKLYDAAFEAYSLNNLPQKMRDFLERCNRSLEVEYELFGGIASSLTEAEQIDRILAKMVDDGDVESPTKISVSQKTKPIISNRDRFPDVDFLDAADIRPIGTVGSTTLVLVGYEQGSQAAIVALAKTHRPSEEELFAMPLYELIGHSFDPIKITDETVRASLL
ncbi:hypothetical protein [Leptolyngbya ohadii]|uniref:hypothetical protein n=1 Tax=Leptolyngbya ohadii TaxID=1962290 RepID=UPI000B59EE12|nr:hypothetical protein [Leptolyngbya ohadii]